MTLTTDPNDPRLQVRPATGEQDVYLVLSEEERAKGFVRPVRHSYKHVGVRPPSNLRPLTEEEQARHSQYGYVGYEAYGPDQDPVVGRFWTQAQLDARGCGVVTSMGRALAETWARNPEFYGRTFCIACDTHLPVEEFIWTTDGTRLGT